MNSPQTGITPSGRQVTFIGPTSPVTVTVNAPQPQSPAVVVSLADPDIIAASTNNGTTNDYELFKNGIAKAFNENASSLIIPPRTYNIQAPQPPTSPAILDFSALHDIVIDGTGATLLFYDTNYQSAIFISNSVNGFAERVLFRGFSIDWNQPLAFPGTIQQLGSSGTQLILNSGYTIDPNNPPRFIILSQFDVANRQYTHSNLPNLDYGTDCYAPNYPANCGVYANNQGVQSFTFPYNSTLAAVPNGTSVLGSTRNFAMSAFEVSGGASDISVENVNIYSSPNSGFMFINANRGFRLSNVHVMRKPDSLLSPGEPPRMISTTGDALDFFDLNGDILVENSEFGFAGDDGTDISGDVNVATNPSNDNQTLLVNIGTPWVFSNNDPVSLYDGTNWNHLGDTTIQNEQFDKTTGIYTITLANPIPQASQVPQLLFSDNNLASSRYYLNGNCYHDDKNRGVLTHSPHGLIQANTITNTTESGIQLSVENYVTAPGNSLGPPLHNVSVIGNVLSENNTADYIGKDYEHQPFALMVYAFVNNLTGDAQSALGDSYSTLPVLSDILIEGNTFSKEPGPAMMFTSSQNVQYSNNTISQVNQFNFGTISLGTTNFMTVPSFSH